MAQDFQDFVDEVREKNDIVEVISEYVKLKRVGNRFAALCPFHNDKKSPSLSVAPDKQLFHCFGCRVGGNVINFIMQIENLDFFDAVKLLADRAHIPVPEQSSPADRKKRIEIADKKQLIYEINAEAARYFFHHLAGEKGKKAFAYLRDRQLDNATIKKFGLGYAPEGWTNLLDYLREKGYKEHDIYEAGLAKMRDNGSYYDVFHDGRVIFPIINVQGNIIGFGGRIMEGGDTVAKYLNTPETLVFKKKENLFGLNLAKGDTSGQMMIMEGYMDVIALHQAGYKNAVASLGTAFTPEQARLLKKYAGKVVLCYDSDGPGRMATLRAGEILTEADMKTKVLTVIDAKDPDEFIKTKGADMFRVLIEQAKPLLMYRIDEVKKEFDLSDPDQNIEFLEKCAEILAEIKNPTEREIYIKQVAKSSDVTETSLESQVKMLMRKKASIEAKKQERQEEKAFKERTGGRRDLHAMGILNAESLLLNLMTEAAVLKKVKSSGLTPEDFTEGTHRVLAAALLNLNIGGNADIHSILSQMPPEHHDSVTAIFMDDKNISDKSSACIQPINLLLGEKSKKMQAELMEQDDLSALDEILKRNKTNRGN